MAPAPARVDKWGADGFVTKLPPAGVLTGVQNSSLQKRPTDPRTINFRKSCPPGPHWRTAADPRLICSARLLLWDVALCLVVVYTNIPSPTLSRATGAVGGTWERSCPPPPAPLERRLTALSRFAPISKKEFWRGPEQILILDTWGRCVKKKRFNKLEKKKSRSS